MPYTYIHFHTLHVDEKGLSVFDFGDNFLYFSLVEKLLGDVVWVVIILVGVFFFFQSVAFDNLIR